MMRPGQSLSLLLLPALFLMEPTSASARCATVGLQAFAMNGVDHPIASDGALLVELRPGGPRTGIVEFPELTLEGDGVSIPLRLEALSSFIARYVPARAPSPGSYRVEGLGVQIRFEARTSSPSLGAPTLRALQRRQRRRRRGTRALVRVVFDRPPPARALAVVVDSERGGFGGGAIPAGAPEVSVYNWGGRCQVHPRGLRSPPPSGEDITVRLVDADGQLGAPATVQMTSG